MIRNRICVLFAAMCLLLAATVFSQTRQAMTLVDLLETPRLTDPQLSPDGSQLLYVLGRADWNANQMQTHI